MKTNTDSLTAQERSLFELYATFGFAFYLAECLAQELCVAFACSDIKSRVEFPAGLEAARKLSATNILETLGARLPNGLLANLRGSLDIRRHLRDEFWRDRLEAREDPRRVDVMLSESSAYVKALMDVRGELAAWVRPVLIKHGINLAVVDQEQN